PVERPGSVWHGIGYAEEIDGEEGEGGIVLHRVGREAGEFGDIGLGDGAVDGGDVDRSARVVPGGRVWAHDAAAVVDGHDAAGLREVGALEEDDRGGGVGVVVDGVDGLTSAKKGAGLLAAAAVVTVFRPVAGAGYGLAGEVVHARDLPEGGG